MTRYSRAFFELQWQFAERVAAISGMPREQALLHYTNFYIRFGLGREFDPNHAVWRIYIDGLSQAGDAVDWTWLFFLARPPVPPPSLVAAFGCFSYSNAGNDAIRLHFANAESGDCSPLSRERIGERRAELRALFDHVDYVRRTRPSIQRVVGTSWLYNLPAYRRLFPSGYVETARESSSHFRNMPLWGQFLDRHGNVRQEGKAILLEHIARQTRLQDIAQCFPLRALAVDAPIALFDGFYCAS
ncbi:hypothetical protein [Paraburkholderia azotifigens]|uniref:Uncharacterized protein n=1 Tax=Paraburkholderia azotifigens TaxID=2057004 RepID=A0A5C6VCH3_9BURK|nr:hypothetical protein [Paraburkholderia azotifigens]TXC82690.1 hypothetical protein FRZ40_19790 [Paraburkholderia azotifigens]